MPEPTCRGGIQITDSLAYCAKYTREFYLIDAIRLVTVSTKILTFLNIGSTRRKLKSFFHAYFPTNEREKSPTNTHVHVASSIRVKINVLIINFHQLVYLRLGDSFNSSVFSVFLPKARLNIFQYLRYFFFALNNAISTQKTSFSNSEVVLKFNFFQINYFR